MDNTQKVPKRTLFSIFAVALLAFAGILSETSMNVTFSHLMTVFDTNLGMLQWITTGYLLAVAIAITLGATLSYNFRERQILFAALILFAVGNGVAIVANDFYVLMIGRILQGSAAGLSIPLMFNLIVERVPKKHLGFYMGLTGLVISLAPAFGPTYGGVMIAHFDWHMIFAFIFPVPIISFVIAYFCLENGEVKEKRPFDYLSFVFLAASLTSLLMVISDLESSQAFNWFLPLVFVMSTALFVRRSLLTTSPLLDIRVLKEPVVFLGLIPFLCYQFANLSSNFLIPNFLVMSKGISSSLAGFALLPGTLTGSILAPFLGKLYDIKGPKLSLFGGNIIIFTSLAIFSFWTSSLTLALVIGTYIVFTIGRNLAFNNTMAYSVSHVDRQKTADVTAWFQMAQTFAGAMGTSIAALIVNQSSSVETGANHVFWLLFVVISLNFIYFILLFRKER